MPIVALAAHGACMTLFALLLAAGVRRGARTHRFASWGAVLLMVLGFAFARLLDERAPHDHAWAHAWPGTAIVVLALALAVMGELMLRRCGAAQHRHARWHAAAGYALLFALLVQMYTGASTLLDTCAETNAAPSCVLHGSASLLFVLAAACYRYGWPAADAPHYGAYATEASLLTVVGLCAALGTLAASGASLLPLVPASVMLVGGAVTWGAVERTRRYGLPVHRSVERGFAVMQALASAGAVCLLAAPAQPPVGVLMYASLGIALLAAAAARGAVRRGALAAALVYAAVLVMGAQRSLIERWDAWNAPLPAVFALHAALAALLCVPGINLQQEQSLSDAAAAMLQQY